MAFPNSFFSNSSPESEEAAFPYWLAGEQPRNKRRRTDARHGGSLTDLPSDDIEELTDSSDAMDSGDDIFNRYMVFPLDEPTLNQPPSKSILSSTDISSANNNKAGKSPRRSFDEAFGVMEPDRVVQDINLGAVLPTFRLVNIGAKNPFKDNEENRIPRLKMIDIALPEHGKLNGYIKVEFRKNDLIAEPDRNSSIRVPVRLQVSEGSQSTTPPETIPNDHCSVGKALGVGPRDRVLRTPKDFGLGCTLSNFDHNLFRFYRNAWCRGRTILPNSNSWLRDIAGMFSGSEILRHALLSLSCTYFLDYVPNERLRKVGNEHYHKAVRILSRQLRDPKAQDIGKADDLVGAISLLNMHDVVSWELRRPHDQLPRWLEGARLACEILDATDTGHRYYRPGNVQSSAARVSNTITIGRVAVLALLFTPLDISNTHHEKFGWLLYGTEKEIYRIYGSCGFCPKIMHTFAQVTHFAAKMLKDPDTLVIPEVATHILQKIVSVRQWSDLSPGFSSTEVLLDSCKLNAEGVIETAEEMTNLTAECWKLAAQLYLLCRLLRFRRNHLLVLRQLALLAECTRRMPCAGPIFTAQAPFLPVFLLGFLATKECHRDTARKWFNTVISATSCRSSVPPAWEALQKIQIWMDKHITDPDETPHSLEARDPWWEKAVARLVETEGTLCLT